MMRKFLLLALTGISLFVNPALAFNPPAKTPITEVKNVTVYITKTGSKYHLDGCRYLRSSKISISKKEAISDGYEACKVCKP